MIITAELGKKFVENDGATIAIAISLTDVKCTITTKISNEIRLLSWIKARKIIKKYLESVRLELLSELEKETHIKVNCKK
jgi:hypothetical protein